MLGRYASTPSLVWNHRGPILLRGVEISLSETTDLSDRLIVEGRSVPERELPLVVTSQKSASIGRPLLVSSARRRTLTLTTRVGDLSLLMEV